MCCCLFWNENGCCHSGPIPIRSAQSSCDGMRLEVGLARGGSLKASLQTDSSKRAEQRGPALRRPLFLTLVQWVRKHRSWRQSRTFRNSPRGCALGFSAVDQHIPKPKAPLAISLRNPIGSPRVIESLHLHLLRQIRAVDPVEIPWSYA